MGREPDVEARLRAAYEDVQPDPGSWDRLEALLDRPPVERVRAGWRWTRVAVAAGLFLLLLGTVVYERVRRADGDGRAAAASFEGTWELELDRPGMEPRLCKGVLVLKRTGRTWQGTLAFSRILYARAHALAEVDVRGSSISFAVVHPEFELRFEGKRSRDVLEGTCRWKRLGTYPFTARRLEAVKRFEEGVKPDPIFPRGDPTELKVDPEALDVLVRLGRETRSGALLVVKDGKLLCERYYGGKDERFHLMSVTKFVTAFAMALLIEEGKIPGVDAPLANWFPEWKEGTRGAVELRHLLTHTSGIHHGESARALNAQRDKVAYVRGLDVEVTPGTEVAYNNEAVALLSGVLAEAAGQPVDAYLGERLFRPLGIEDWAWDRDGAGNTITYAQLGMHARDLARLGWLVAERGRWGGEQVVPAAWIDRLGTPTPLNPRCGLLWWVLEEGDEAVAIYHTGWLGQWLVILPKERMVGVRLRRADGPDDPAFELGGFLKALRDLPVRDGDR